LISKDVAESTNYARVIATNATVQSLTLPETTNIRDLGRLSA